MHQTEIFNDQNNSCKVLVATDAVGMGLNLAIQRIIFHGIEKQTMVENNTALIEKFTSKKMQMTPSQAKQIAGRAGRYGGLYNMGGEVTAFHEKDLIKLKDILNQELPDIKRAGLTIRDDVVETIAYHLPGVPLSSILMIIVAISKTDKQFFLCDTGFLIQNAMLLDHIKMPVREKMLFCQAPLRHTISGKSIVLYMKMANHVSKGLTLNLDWFMTVLEFFMSDLKEIKSIDHALEVFHMTDIYLWLSSRFENFQDIDKMRSFRKELDKALREFIEKTYSNIGPEEVIREASPPKEAIREASLPKEAIRKASPPIKVTKKATPPREAIRKASPPYEVITEASPAKEAIRKASPPIEGIRKVSTPKQVIRKALPPKEGVREASPPKQVLRKSSPLKEAIRISSPPKEAIRKASQPIEVIGKASSPCDKELELMGEKRLQEFESPTETESDGVVLNKSSQFPTVPETVTQIEVKPFNLEDSDTILAEIWYESINYEPGEIKKRGGGEILELATARGNRSKTIKRSGAFPREEKSPKDSSAQSVDQPFVGDKLKGFVSFLQLNKLNIRDGAVRWRRMSDQEQELYMNVAS